MNNRKSIDYKRSLGQCFLVNDNILQSICKECLQTNAPIVEIGCGSGNLTKHLIQTGREIIGVEFDREMEKHLRELTEAYPNFRLIMGDALDLTYEKHKSYVGNLPYNIGSRILLNCVESGAESMVFLLQREVVNRVCARVGSSDYGSLSVLIQSYYEVKGKMIIKPSNFYPRPSVDSKLLVCKKLNTTNTPFHQMSKLLKQSFASPRKMLSNTIGKTQPKTGEFIDLTRRPGQLSVAEYIELAGGLRSDL